jgi:hypothetical protein
MILPKSGRLDFDSAGENGGQVTTVRTNIDPP